MRAAGLYSIVLGFLIGVFARSFLLFGWWTIMYLGAGGLMLAGFSFLRPSSRTLLPALFLVALSLGCLRMQFGIHEHVPAIDAYLGSKAVLEGVVTDEPDLRENNVRIPVRIASVASTTVAESVSVLISAPLHTDIHYGDRVRAVGELGIPEPFETGSGREFDYPAYLAKDGILYEMSFARVEKIGEVRRNPLRVAAIWIRETYVGGISIALPEPEAGLASGITAGDKRGLGKDLSDVFRTVGLVHIVVLSGYNIMIVISFIERLFSWTRLWVRSVMGIVIAILFALMTGLAASSVRAASMAIIATAGKTSGRTYLAERALVVVAFLMVLWNPYVLAFDPGFQLSFLATLGLMYIAPLFATRLQWVTERFGLRETAASSLGTQAAVLPLLLYQNGMLSLYSLPTNLLALVTVPYAMLLSFIAGVCGAVFPALSPIVGFPAYLLLTYIVHIAEFFAGLPFAQLAVPVFAFGWLCAAYILLAAVVVVYQKKSAKPDRASP